MKERRTGRIKTGSGAGPGLSEYDEDGDGRCMAPLALVSIKQGMVMGRRYTLDFILFFEQLPGTQNKHEHGVWNGVCLGYLHLNEYG